MINDKLNNLIKLAQGNRTQNEFAMHCGINSAALTRILKGEYEPSPATLKKIANKAYNGVTYRQLILAAGIVEDADLTMTNPEQELDGVYLRLAKEAQEKGLTPNDVRKIISLYEMFKKEDGK